MRMLSYPSFWEAQEEDLWWNIEKKLKKKITIATTLKKVNMWKSGNLVLMAQNEHVSKLIFADKPFWSCLVWLNSYCVQYFWRNRKVPESARYIFWGFRIGSWRLNCNLWNRNLKKLYIVEFVNWYYFLWMLR